MVPSSRRSIATAGSPNEIGRSGASLWPAVTEMLGFALMSGRFHLCGLAVEKGADPKFCLLVALRHRCHQRSHRETVWGLALGNHGRRLRPGKVGNGCFLAHL